MDAQSQTPSAPKSDAEQNKWFAVLAYLGILCLIPLLAAKKSPFAQYHAKQGLVLFLASIAVSVGYGLIIAFLPGRPFGFVNILSIVKDVLNLGIFVLSIMGLIYAWKGETKELPVLGAYAKKFKF